MTWVISGCPWEPIWPAMQSFPLIRWTWPQAECSLQKRIWHLTILETGYLKSSVFIIPSYHTTEPPDENGVFPSNPGLSSMMRSRKRMFSVWMDIRRASCSQRRDTSIRRAEAGHTIWRRKKARASCFLNHRAGKCTITAYKASSSPSRTVLGTGWKLDTTEFWQKKSSHSAGMKLGLPMKTAEWRSFGTRRVVSSSTNTGNAA